MAIENDHYQSPENLQPEHAATQLTKDVESSIDSDTHYGGALTDQLPHPHRWRIEEPEGPISRGCCKHCGMERYFKNWLSDMDVMTNEDHRVERESSYYA